MLCMRWSAVGLTTLAEIGTVYGVPKALRLMLQQMEKTGRYAAGGVVYDSSPIVIDAKIDAQVAHPEMSSVRRQAGVA